MSATEYRDRCIARYRTYDLDDLIREAQSEPSPWNRAGANPENHTPAKVRARRIRLEAIDQVLSEKRAAR
ncbi:MAG: hypothetical protein H0W82_02210 [Actinobacteria bacterium]|nr:hypothetical protein [Actinomycetota bacterium]